MRNVCLQRGTCRCHAIRIGYSRLMRSDTPDARCYTFTVFTPTYNRAATLARVYDSLQYQTFRDFEWVIVDDGSEDETADLVERWRSECDFPIRYVWQPNQGKHIAFNRGVELARGEFFLTLDSDDACVPDALERLKYHWDQIPTESKSAYASVTGLCVDQDGRLVGDRFPKDVLDATSIEITYRYKVRGEKWGFTRTEVLRELPFPNDGHTKFVPESLTWDVIAERYCTRYVNDVLRIYWVRRGTKSTELAPGTYVSRYAQGNAALHLFALNKHLGLFRHDPVSFILSAVEYTRFSSLDHQSPLRQVRQLRNPGAMLLWWLTLPFGAAAFALDVNRMSRSDVGRQLRTRSSSSHR
jgi:glycosyltransferase involved in cell wall biosynthesis